MTDFLRKIWVFAWPYRGRLYLGVLTGVISGLVGPLLIMTAMFVYAAVFPSARNVYGKVTLNVENKAGAAGATYYAIASKNPDGKLAFSSKSPLTGATNYVVAATNLSLPLAQWTVVATNSPMADRPPLKYMPGFVNNWFYNARDGLSSGLQTHPAAVWALIALIPFISLLRGVSGYLNVYFLQWAGTRAVADLRTKLFAHLLDLSAGFYTKNATGELVSRVMNDTQQLQTIVTNVTSVIVRDPINLIGVLALLIVQQPRLTLLSLIILPACIVPIAIYSRKIRRSSKEAQSQLAGLVETMTEGFTGHRVIKAYNLEKIVSEKFRETAKRSVSLIMRITRASEMPGMLIEFFGACGLAVMLFYLVKTGEQARPTDFLQLLVSLIYIYQPLKNLTRLQNQIVQARAATERVFEMLAMTNSVPEPAAPKMLHADKADIVFENLDFNYGEKPVLRNINLTVKAGQLVALVGASGSGKTTMANLLLRFYDPVRGCVKIGGVDVREVHTRDLRNQIAVVAQENILFNDTVRRNIELGRLGATNAEIAEAARFAKADEFILQKPEGFDMVVGEKGSRLSGGQRQRLAIARAVLRNAPILILDEATSALDTEVERAVQAELDSLMQGRTTLCIAHRLSTIMHADVIVVLDQGRIVEQGRHEDLIKRGGHYQKLYELQFSP
jgi:subfamily B ATP-binding cassette protein MsbA